MRNLGYGNVFTMTLNLEHLRAKNLVWHYTTLEALQSILSTHTLLATEVSYQNDPREPETGVELVAETLSLLEDVPAYERFARAAQRWYHEWRNGNGHIQGRVGRLVGNSRFIFCASTDPDNLYAWRTYGAGLRTGCAIGLDPNVPLGMLADQSGHDVSTVAKWTEVIYDPKRRLEFAMGHLIVVGDAWKNAAEVDDELAREHLRNGRPEHEAGEDSRFNVMFNELADAVSAITAVAKHQSFQDEREVRVTFADVANGVVFSPGARGPRPRIRLAASERWGQVVGSPQGLLPIRAIVLAPNAGREAATTAEWLLHAHDYPLDPYEFVDESGPEPILRSDPSTAIEIYRSTHPYRDV